MPLHTKVDGEGPDGQRLAVDPLYAGEGKWVHGKRKVAEPERLLGAYELACRVCWIFGCAHEPHVSIPQEVA